MSAEQFQQLMNRVNALENGTQQPAPQSQVGINAMGQVTGTVFHGDTDKEKYEDPTEKLAKEKRFRKFTIDEDYRFEFEVVVKEWMKDGLRHAAPRFRIYVWRTVRKDEDPDVIEGYALVQRSDFKDYDYVQFYNWVETVFYPAKIKPTIKSTEMVIGGKLVEFKESEKIENVQTNR